MSPKQKNRQYVTVIRSMIIHINSGHRGSPGTTASTWEWIQVSKIQTIQYKNSPLGPVLKSIELLEDINSHSILVSPRRGDWRDKEFELLRTDIWRFMNGSMTDIGVGAGIFGLAEVKGGMYRQHGQTYEDILGRNTCNWYMREADGKGTARKEYHRNIFRQTNSIESV